MLHASGFTLGSTTNLLQGLKSDWNPQQGQLDILYPVPKPPMAVQPPILPEQQGEWSYPIISLHDTALSLLDTLIPYRVIAPSSDIDRPNIGAGALLVGAHHSEAALAALSSTLGVDLADPTLRYALVKLERVDGTLTHPSLVNDILVHVRPRQPDASYGLSAAFISASNKLPHAGRSRRQDYGNDLSLADGQRILQHFDEFGTHYVAGLSFGDTILQVFAYKPEQFEQIKRAYADGTNPLSGHGSQNFVQFTTDHQAGIFGFVHQYGQLLCLSNSEIFQHTVAEQLWVDRIWSKRTSVLSIFNPQAALSLFRLKEQFTAQTTTHCALASLAVMIEQKRGLLWQRIFKGALVQKYRDTVQANFAIYDHRDFVRMLPQDVADVASFIATPHVNVYKTRLDLSKMQLVAASEVKTFDILTNVLALSSPVWQVPSPQVRLFAQVFDMRVSGQPHQLVLQDQALASLQMACDEFLGALVLRNPDGQQYRVIVDGLCFDLVGQGAQAKPILVDDVRRPAPSSATVDLIDNLQFSMSFAEAVISDQSCCPNDGIQQLARDYLRWIIQMIPSDTDSPEVLALRVRALDLSHYLTDPNYGSFVPILPYQDYEKYVYSILSYLDRIQLQIAQNEQRLANRRQQELVIDVAKTLNQNIIESGQLISGIIDANVAQQKDLEGFYDGVIAQNQAEATRQQQKINELNLQLNQSRADVDAAVQHYQSAVQQWQTMEAIKFGLDVATNLFSLGTSFLIPASSISAVKDLGLTAQRIQKTLNVLNATSKLYTGISTGLKGLTGAQQTLDELSGESFGNTSSLSWDEMSIWFNQIMATGPDVKLEKAALQAAFSIMILRGKAVTSAQSALHTIQRDIYTNQLQKQINQRQADRLSQLQNKLHPAEIKDLDRAAIDLMALTGHLTFIQNQMLTILAKAFLQQDQALQYQFLQPATPITAFSVLQFSAAIVQQTNQTTQAKTALAPYQPAKTRPIEFVIAGVRPQDLINGNILQTTIFLDAPEFRPYVNARILAVVASIDGIKSTDSGDYLLRLAFNGSPFFDRNLQRDTLTFRTPWRERIYSYNANTGQPNFSDDGFSWSEGVSRITPFSTWELSLPPSTTNQGLRFESDLLTIRLSFVLEARIVDALKSSRMRSRMARQAISPALLGVADPINLPSVDTLLAQMYAQGSCTNGWDVVFNMGLAEINAALKDQYNDLKLNTDYKNVIRVETAEEYPGVIVINRFYIEYGYPLLNFSVNNNNTAVLNMEILKGSVQRCSKIGDQEVCTPAESIAGQTFTAVIPLEKANGQVQIDSIKHQVLKVQLNMAEGAFSVSNMNLSDVTKLEFNKALKAYFVSNPVVYLINQLDLTNIPTLEALRPNDFLFKPLQTQSGNQMLQLFIMTGNRAVQNYSLAFLNNIPEPLPIGQNSSMIISSALVFRDILPQSLKTNGWILTGNNPNDTAKAWTGTFTSASVVGTVDLSKLNHSTSSSWEGGGSLTEYTYSIPGGNDVSWSLVGTTLSVQANGELLYGGSQKQVLKYNQHACTTVYPCFWSCTNCSDSTLSTDVTVNATGYLPLNVNGDGRNQTIQVVMNQKDITVSGHLSGGGPSGSDDLAAQVNQQIQSQVPQQIKEKLSLHFDAVSVFALKNLLFPSNNYIQFTRCAVPGDLLLLGNFVKI